MNAHRDGDFDRADEIPEAAIRTTRFGQFFIWLIPVAAAVVSAFLLWQYYMTTGPRIEIVFQGEVSVEEGRTSILHLGVKVGEVQGVRLNDDLRSVTVTAVLSEEHAKSFMRAGTRYWLVEPEINFPNVSGLKYLVQGAHIAALPGDGKILLKNFTALPGPPERIANPADKVVLLKSANMESLSVGSKVLFRGVEVGRVTKITLASDGRSAYAEAVIDPGYGDLVAPGSVFWTRKIFEANFDLFSGASVDVGSLGDFLRGTVSFATPPEDIGEYVPDRTTFVLQESPGARLPGTSPGLQIVLRSATMKDVTKGALIVYRGAKIGEVGDITIAEGGRMVFAQATILPEYAYLVAPNSTFRLQKGFSANFDLTDGASFDMGPVRNIVQGAIAMNTPPDAIGRGAAEGAVYELLPPVDEEGRPAGRRLHLVAERFDGLTKGAGVFYRGIGVGEVLSKHVGADAQSAVATLLIYEDYIGLVAPSSRFWMKQAVDADFSFFGGASVDIGSISEILKGGVTFSTPPADIGAGFEAGMVFRISDPLGDEDRDRKEDAAVDGAVYQPNARPRMTTGDDGHSEFNR